MFRGSAAPCASSVLAAGALAALLAHAASASAGNKPPKEVTVILEDEPEDVPETPPPQKKRPKRKPAEAPAPADEDRATPDEEPTPKCESDSDCEKGQRCGVEGCVQRAPTSTSSEPSVWLGLGLVQEFAVASGTDVCSENGQVNSGYTCTRSSGSQYHGTPVRGAGGKLSGLALGTTRVTLGADLKVAASMSAGLRFGYAIFGKAPTPDGGRSFLPISAELHGAYWPSGVALSPNWIGSFVELSGGVAELASHQSVRVREDTSVPPPTSQIDNPNTQTLTAYQNAGRGFVGAGAGAFFPIGSAGGLLANLRLSAYFPTSGFALQLGVGGVLGL